MKIIVFNKEEAQDYLLNQIDDEEVIYININNNVAHRTLNSKSMFGKNIETFNMYFADLNGRRIFAGQCICSLGLAGKLSLGG